MIATMAPVDEIARSERAALYKQLAERFVPAVLGRVMQRLTDLGLFIDVRCGHGTPAALYNGHRVEIFVAADLTLAALIDSSDDLIPLGEIEDLGRVDEIVDGLFKQLPGLPDNWQARAAKNSRRSR